MNRSIVKSKRDGTLYEVQYLFHSDLIDVDLYVCYRLSVYDGMPIGGLVYVLADEVY